MNSEQAEVLEGYFRAYFHPMMVHAYRYVGDWSCAEEAAQIAFCTACANIEALQKSVNPLGWLKQATYYACMGILRERKRYAMLLLSIEDPSGVSEDAYIIPASEGSPFSDVLKPEDVEILRRIFLNGESYRAVAESQHISVWGCYKRVERIKQKLQKHYGIDSSGDVQDGSKVDTPIL